MSDTDLPPLVDIRDDPTVDSTAAVQAWLDSGQPLPPGRYRVGQLRPLPAAGNPEEAALVAALRVRPSTWTGGGGDGTTARGAGGVVVRRGSPDEVLPISGFDPDTRIQLRLRGPLGVPALLARGWVGIQDDPVLGLVLTRSPAAPPPRFCP